MELLLALGVGLVGGIGCHYLCKNEKPVGPNWPEPPEVEDSHPESLGELWADTKKQISSAYKEIISEFKNVNRTV